MRIRVYPSASLRGFCFAAFVALFLLAACGKRQSASSQTPPKPSSGHSVTISWAPSKSAVAGYIVYRVNASGKIERLTRSLVSDTKYTDATVEAGQTYSYYVTSVDAKGVESKPSDKIAATVPATPPKQ
jgi:fibronectin type III domain protein